MISRRQVLQATAGSAAAAMVGTASAVALPRAATADYSTTPDPTSNWGAWEGWGTSLCWWANVFGMRDDLADILFTRDTVSYDSQSLPGLGLNIVRYNIGGCSSTPINGDSMVASPNIPSWKQIQGYWLNWTSSDPASDSWNWWVDSNQRNAMWKARDRGVNLIDMFSDTPMWWMCSNHNPSGADDGGDNLQSRSELDARGLTNTLVAASDETSYDQARTTWSSFSSATKDTVGRVNFHGYQYEGGRRDLLYDDVHAAGKPLWMSEYGEGRGSGMRLATNLCLDMRWLHPTAWVYWQAYDGFDKDGGAWGLIQVDEDNGTVGAVNPKYWVLTQYARHIRPGMRILSGGADVNTVAAYDTSASRLVLVTANYGTPQWVTYDLSRFSSVGGGANGVVRRWITVTGAGGERYGAHPSDTTLNGKQFWSWFPANSIQTFEIDNVSL